MFISTELFYTYIYVSHYCAAFVTFHTPYFSSLSHPYFSHSDLSNFSYSELISRTEIAPVSTRDILLILLIFIGYTLFCETMLYIERDIHRI